MMRDALVEAKIGLTAVRAAVEESRGKLSTEQSELETVRRRGRLAAEIGDHQTVQVALQFERRHTERLAVIEHKLKAQEEELALAERDVAEMTAQFRSAAAGIDPFGGPPRDTSAVFGETDEVDALRRELERAARESDADRRLAELKRRMGKSSECRATPRGAALTPRGCCSRPCRARPQCSWRRRSARVWSAMASR
jgi:phage shock protein A